MVGIALNKDYDLQINVQHDADDKISGMVLSEITPQNQALILGCNKGEFKEHPNVGVGLSSMTLDHDLLAWQREIREQLEFDGQTVTEIIIKKDSISVDAHY